MRLKWSRSIITSAREPPVRRSRPASRRSASSSTWRRDSSVSGSTSAVTSVCAHWPAVEMPTVTTNTRKPIQNSDGTPGSTCATGTKSQYSLARSYAKVAENAAVPASSMRALGVAGSVDRAARHARATTRSRPSPIPASIHSLNWASSPRGSTAATTKRPANSRLTSHVRRPARSPNRLFTRATYAGAPASSAIKPRR